MYIEKNIYLLFMITWHSPNYEEPLKNRDALAFTLLAQYNWNINIQMLGV
jgi:hypothetical protein